MRRSIGWALPAAVLAGVAATVAVGLALSTTHPLGTALPPFFMSWFPDVRPRAAVGGLVAGLLVFAAPLAVDRVRPPAVFAALAYLGSLALGLAVNLARRGPGGWDHVFAVGGANGSVEGTHEYLPVLGDLRGGVAHYVRDFPRLLPGLPTHVKGNPPGPLVAMHLLGITTPARLAAACVIVGSLCAPLAYGLGAELAGERTGRLAAVLTMFSPSIVLYGVTSVDFAFAGLGAAVAALMVTRPTGARIAGCVLAGIAAFFSYVLLAIPVWAVLCVARREGIRSGVALALGAVAGIVGVTLVLAAVWGYDPIAIVRALRGLYAAGAAAQRPYAFWVFGSPAAFLVFLGPPIVWLSLRALARGDGAALALAAVILVSTLSGFTKAETERIWLPYVPLAAVAAATLPIRRLRLLLAALAAQAILVELLFKTVF